MIVFFDPTFFQNLLISFILFPYFLIAIFFAFYIPGSLVLGSVKKYFPSVFQRITLSIVTGIVLWAYQGFLFGFLGMRFLTYLYIIIFFIFWLLHRRKQIAISYKDLLSKLVKLPVFHYILIMIFIIGIFGQTQKFWVAGSMASDGMHIFASAADDELYQTALIRQIVNRFPPFEPGLVGINVRNYHYLSNLIIADLVRVFHLPLLSAQFQYMYLLISFLLGAVSWTLARQLRFSVIASMVFVYLQYFASDLLYILTYITSHRFDFTTGPIEGGVEFLENPPRAFAIVIVLCGFVFFNLWIKKKKIKIGILTALLFASLIGFKIHTALPLFIGLFIFGCYALLKKQFSSIVILCFTAVLVLAIYLPVNKSAGGLLFTPFWITRDFAVQPLLHISSFELARETYAIHNNGFGVFRMDIIMLVLFLVCQIGVRSVGFIPYRPFLRALSFPGTIVLYTAIIAGIILGTFFYEQTGGANIFNFFLTSSLLLSIPAAYLVGALLQKRYVGLFVLIFLLLFTLPRWIYRTHLSFLYFQKSTPIIWNGQLQAMEFIARHTDPRSVVLVFNKGQWDYRYPYVSIFTQRDMFSSGEWVLGNHDVYDYKSRDQVKETLLTSTDPYLARNLLQKNHIDILYFYGNPVLPKGSNGAGIKKIFQNGYNTIYQFKAVP